MKKTILTLLAFCVSIMFASAQGTATTPAATPAKTTKAAPAKTAAKTDATKTAKTAPAKTGTSNAQHLKKDGTPDMRYKENKAATGTTKPGATAAPVKKDGTPDKRYSGNKAAPAKTPATTAPKQQ